MCKIILASKSKVRMEILKDNGISFMVCPSNVDEDEIKKSLLNEGATPQLISRNLAEIKANKVSQMKLENIVIGADSVIDLEGKIISKPKDRSEAMDILKKLNGKKHDLISSVCISKKGKMIWNHSDKATLTMKKFSEDELQSYLSELTDEALYSYNVYQIEGKGKNLFSNIKGDKNTIMGLPIKKIKKYLEVSRKK